MTKEEKARQDRLNKAWAAKVASESQIRALPDKAPTGSAVNGRESVGGTDFDFIEMLKNIPQSAGQFATDVATPFMHPVDTFNAVTDLGSGALNKATEYASNALPRGMVESLNRAQNEMVGNNTLGVESVFGVGQTPIAPEEMQYQNIDKFDAMTDFVGNRYGSVDRAKQTLMNDPVGLLSDASAVVTGGASMVPKVGKAGAIANKVKQVARAADPLNLALNTGRTSIAGLLDNDLPNKMYQKSAKFSNAKNAPDPAVLADTALKYDLPPNAAGVGKLTMLKGELINRIDQIIDTATASNVEIPKGAVFKHLSELRADMGGVKLRGSKNKSAITAIAKEFDEHMKKLGKDTITPRELQDFKLDIYRDNKYGQKTLQGTRIGEKTEKAFARAAKELLEQQDPSVAGLNKQLGELSELEPGLQSAANRIEKRNPISIDSGINIAAGGAGAGPAGAIAGGGLSLLAYPNVQQNLARGLYKQKMMGLGGLLMGNPALTTGSQAAFQSGRETNRVPPLLRR